MPEAYRTIPAAEAMQDFSPDRLARMHVRSDAIIAEEMALRDIRRARSVTQEQLAQRLGGKQVYISRLEKRSDVKLSTLHSYIKALGGDLQLLVTFPDGVAMKIGDRPAAGK